MRTFVSVRLILPGWALVLVLSGALTCQDPRNIPDGQEPRKERGREEGDPLERERSVREWGEIVETMSDEERRSFRALPDAEKAKEIGRRLKARQLAREEAFLESLPEQVVEELNKLDPKARALRIAALRIDQEFQRVLGDAQDRGLLTPEQVAEAEAEKDLLSKAQRTITLQKDIFLSVHREEFERMGTREKEALKALPPQEFFRSPLLRGLMVRKFIPRDAMMDLRQAGPAILERFLNGIRDGKVTPEDQRFLRPSALTELSKMSLEERGRLAQVLRRTHFFREVPSGEDSPEKPPPGGRRRRSEFLLPPDLWRKLPSPDQEVFLKLSPEGRQHFARSRFPDWFQRQRGTAAPTLRAVLDRLKALEESERERLLDAPFHETMRRLGFDAPPERRPPPDGGRPPGRR